MERARTRCVKEEGGYDTAGDPLAREPVLTLREVDPGVETTRLESPSVRPRSCEARRGESGTSGTVV